MKVVRLTEKELAAIILGISESFDKDQLSAIGLFGSRADLSKKGGDIDIIIWTKDLSFDLYSTLNKIRRNIWNKIGEQKIDIFICPSDLNQLDERNKAFYLLIKDKCKEIWKK
jgi:predicted nucleotidyltransferase